MLLPYTTLTYYGPCAAAAVGSVSPTANATMRATARLGAFGQAIATAPRAAMTRGLYMAAFGVSTALSPIAQMRTRVRMGAIGKVNALTQGDVAAAVWGQASGQYNLAGTFGAKLNSAGGSADPWSVPIEGTYTAAEIMRLVASVLVGRVSGAGSGTEVFRDLNDTKDRVTSTVDLNGNRTNVAVDET